MRRQRIRLLAAVSGVVLTLTACGGSTGSSDAGMYNWGVDAELSGVMSFIGQSIADGVGAYVDHVNAEGGINGHKIKLTVLDDGGDQSRAAANATQLATVDGVNAIFGHALSANCSAAQPIAERNRIPMACLSVAATSPYVFNMGPDNARAAETLFAAAKKVTGKSKPTAAFVYLNTLTTIALSKSVSAKAPAAGVDVTTSQQIELTATDVSGPVARIADNEPDVVLMSNTGPGFASFLKAARAAGITAPFVWLDGTANLASLVESRDQGVYAFTIHELVEPAATDAAAKDYVSAITPRLKDGVSATTLNSGEGVPGYMAARAFGEALRGCGFPCDGEKLKAELEKLDIELPGLVSKYGYTPENHYPFKEWYLYHVVGTRATLVESLPTGEAGR